MIVYSARFRSIVWRVCWFSQANCLDWCQQYSFASRSDGKSWFDQVKGWFMDVVLTQIGVFLVLFWYLSNCSKIVWINSSLKIKSLFYETFPRFLKAIIHLLSGLLRLQLAKHLWLNSWESLLFLSKMKFRYFDYSI